MLFSIRHTATGRAVLTTLTTSFPRPLVLRAAARSRFQALDLYGCGFRNVRGLATSGRPKKAATPKGAQSAPAKKPAKKPVKKIQATTKPKSKTKAKPKSSPKAKTKSRPKAKATSKRAKRVISPERKAVLRRKALKKVALFAEPKTLPVQAWQLYVVEHTKGKGDGQKVISRMASLARGFKAISQGELQRLQTTAEQNKASNAVEYKAWVESHSPQEIYDANIARKALKRVFNFPKGSLKLIRDERLPKRPPTPFSLFTKARWASGDYAPGSFSTMREVTTRIAQEWKSLTAAERRPYDDLALSHSENYEKVVNTVLPARPRRAKSPSS